LQLDGAGRESIRGLTGVNLSEVVAEKKPSDEETAEVEVASKWQVDTTRDGEDNMGDQCDLPRGNEEVNLMQEHHYQIQKGRRGIDVDTSMHQRIQTDL
jgi:hypothetical protein